MRKKDYELIARVLKYHQPKHDPEGYATDNHASLCEELARYFGEANPKFDKQKFLTACGIFTSKENADYLKHDNGAEFAKLG